MSLLSVVHIASIMFTFHLSGGTIEYVSVPIVIRALVHSTTENGPNYDNPKSPLVLTWYGDTIFSLNANTFEEREILKQSTNVSSVFADIKSGNIGVVSNEPCNTNRISKINVYSKDLRKMYELGQGYEIAGAIWSWEKDVILALMRDPFRADDYKLYFLSIDKSISPRVLLDLKTRDLNWYSGPVISGTNVLFAAGGFVSEYSPDRGVLRTLHTGFGVFAMDSNFIGIIENAQGGYVLLKYEILTGITEIITKNVDLAGVPLYIAESKKMLLPVIKPFCPLFELFTIDLNTHFSQKADQKIHQGFARTQ